MRKLLFLVLLMGGCASNKMEGHVKCAEDLVGLCAEACIKNNGSESKPVTVLISGTGVKCICTLPAQGN